MRTSVPGMVVVGVDGSPDDCLVALRFAALEANRRHVGVRLVHGCEPLATVTALEPTDPPARRAELGRAALTQATKRIWPLLNVGVRVETRVHPGTGAEALLEESERASLIIVQRRNVTALRHLATGSTSSRVAARAHCPVVVVRTGQTLTGRERGVLVGVDASGHAQASLATAFEEAFLRRTTLTALHAWTWQKRPITYGWVPPTADELEAHRQQARLVLAESLAGFAGDYPDVIVHERLVNAPVMDALQHASGQAGLLVVGRHGSGHLGSLSVGRVFLGSVARHCLAAADCPVLLSPASRVLERHVTGRGTRTSRQTDAKHETVG